MVYIFWVNITSILYYTLPSLITESVMGLGEEVDSDVAVVEWPA